MREPQIRTVPMKLENYNKILAVKKNRHFKDTEKVNELIRLFRAKEFDRMSFSAIFDVYRNFDTAKFKKTIDNKKVICKIADHSGFDIRGVKE